MLFPFIHELAKSFSYPTEVAAGRVSLWPKRFTWGNYLYFAKFKQLWRSFANSVIITVVGTIWTVFMTAMMAYPLSRSIKEFKIGRAIRLVVVFSMVFFPPMIPYFLAIRSYGLMDNYGALILTHTVYPYYLLMMISFYQGLEEGLLEAARIDGAGDFRLFWQFALPLSKPVLATITIFTAALYWNMFMHPMLFIRSADLQPLQMYVRGIMQGGGDIARTASIQRDPFAESESIKSALVIMTTIPIVAVYPFLQKHFMKGAQLGSIKG